MARPRSPDAVAFAFAGRREAGMELADALDGLRAESPLVVAIGPGGVPLGLEVAEDLGAEFDMIVVTRVVAAAEGDADIGALAEGGTRMIDDEAVRALDLGELPLRESIADAEERLTGQVREYRAHRAARRVRGRTVVLVDDAVATGRTARAAVAAVRAGGAARIVLAVPLGSSDSLRALRADVDELVCLRTAPGPVDVDRAYGGEPLPTERQVTDLLDRDERAHEQAVREVSLHPWPGVALPGQLMVPVGARGTVLFAHSSGSGRSSVRNRAVATALHQAGLATLLFDLFGPGERDDPAKAFSVSVVAERLGAASRWVRHQPETACLPVGIFGAGLGAAAALTAAASPRSEIAAVVSRSGRLDLAEAPLAEVRAPTLLIVGEEDLPARAVNEEAQRELRCPNDLALVPRGAHLWDEPDTLDAVGRLAAEWFSRHLQAAAATA